MKIKELDMKVTWLLAASAAAIALQMPSGAQAFECPKHFADAQAIIDKVTGDMKGDMSKKMPKDQIALVHALVDDAKMWLASGKHNHENPRGMYDHARAIAKADAARGSAVAADILHFKMMQM